MATTTNIVYDTHAAIQRLTGAGMPESQAEAVVREQTQLLEHNLATKQDIALIQQNIALVQQDIVLIQRDIEAQSLATHKDIEIIHKDIESLRAEVKKDMQVLSSQLTVRMGAMLVAAVGVLASLQTFAG